MDKNLRLIFTSDIHGYFFPTDFISEDKKQLGLLHIASKFNKNENTLIIDGGDTLQGSPLTYYCREVGSPEIIAKIMNEVGYDFITIGNHDFNYGYEYFKRYLQNLNAECVCENCLDDEGNSLYPYKILIMDNGVKVGVVGCITDVVNTWEREENLVGVNVVKVFDRVKKAYDEIKDKVDISICVYHGGFECDLKNGEVFDYKDENIGGKICKELGFDILLTAHQHRGICGQYFFGTYIVQNFYGSNSFHEINISLNENTKNINSKMFLSNEIDFDYDELPFKEEENRIKKWMNTVVGYLNKELLAKSFLDMAINGSELADFINNVQMSFSDADISCTSFPNNVVGLPREVRIKDVILTYPFSNKLVVVEVMGSDLKKILERAAEYFEFKNGNVNISEKFLIPKVEHYNYDYFYGIEYDIAYENKIGDRISNIRVKGEEVEALKVYKVCTNNYRAFGTGGYDMYKNFKVVSESKEEIFEMIIKYIKRMGNNQ